MKNQKTIMLCLAFGILGIALHSADSVNGSEKNNQLKNALLDFQNHNNINISECDANGDGIVNVIDLCRMKAEIISNQEYVFVSDMSTITTYLTVPAESTFLATTPITTTPITTPVTSSQTYTSVSTSRSGAITTAAYIYGKAKVHLTEKDPDGYGNRSVVIAEFDTWAEAQEYASEYYKEHPGAELAISQASSPAVTSVTFKERPVTSISYVYTKAKVELTEKDPNGYGNRTVVIAEFDTWAEAQEYASEYYKEHPGAILSISQGTRPAVTDSLFNERPVTSISYVYTKAKVELTEKDPNGYGNRTVVIAEFDTWAEAQEYASEYYKEHPEAILAISQGRNP